MNGSTLRWLVILAAITIGGWLGLARMNRPAPQTGATTATWTTGWGKASALATTAKKPILADFTGSDWCGWCIKLKEEVFNTPEFAAWAARSVVLLEVDFPMQSQLDPALAAENNTLARDHGIDAFPSILFLDASGAELGRLGYQAGGPEAWIAAADKILAARH